MIAASVVLVSKFNHVAGRPLDPNDYCDSQLINNDVEFVTAFDRVTEIEEVANCTKGLCVLEAEMTAVYTCINVTRSRNERSDDELTRDSDLKWNLTAYPNAMFQTPVTIPTMTFNTSIDGFYKEDDPNTPVDAAFVEIIQKQIKPLTVGGFVDPCYFRNSDANSTSSFAKPELTQYFRIGSTRNDLNRVYAVSVDGIEDVLPVVYYKRPLHDSVDICTDSIPSHVEEFLENPIFSSSAPTPAPTPTGAAPTAVTSSLLMMSALLFLVFKSA